MESTRPPIFTLQDNPDFFYRAIADRSAQGGLNPYTVADVLDDFAKTGQIRGTSAYNHDAYFLRGSYWDPIASPKSGSIGLTTWGEPYVSPLPNGAPRSMKITVDPVALNAAENPLYGAAGGWKNKYASVPENYPVIVHPSSASRSVYPQIQPNPDASFADIIDFRNRAGIKMQANTGQLFYDRITPFLERPMSTHASNIGMEARIIGNAIKSNPVAAAGTALGVAGAGLSVYDMRQRAQEGAKKGESERQQQYDKSTNISGSFPYTQAFLAETGARMPGYLEGLTNMATFGVYDATAPIRMQMGDKAVKVDPNDMPPAAFYGP